MPIQSDIVFRFVALVSLHQYKKRESNLEYYHKAKVCPH